jgi:hypothetical protein
MKNNKYILLLRWRKPNMFIKPCAATMPKNTGNEYYDEFGNRYKDIIKRLSYNEEDKIARFEKIAFIYEDDIMSEPRLYKECAVGPIKTHKEEEYVKFRNYTYSITDINSGKYLSSGGFCDYPSENEKCDSYVIYGYMNMLVPNNIMMKDESIKKIPSPSFKSIDFTPFTINCEANYFESKYQLPYTDTFGLLSSFFSTWTYSYPFECYVHIDVKRKCFNIPKISYLPYIEKEAIKEIYANFINEVSNISTFLCNVIIKERRDISIKIFLHPFGSVMKIFDNDYKRSETFYNHNSTQVQSIMKNVKLEGLKYIGSEGLGLLESSIYKEPVDQALECCDILY